MTMRINIFKYLKLISLILSACFIGYGWVLKIEIISKIGAFLYLLVLIAGFVTLIIESIKYRNGNWEKQMTEKSIFDSISNILEGLVLVSGVIAMITDNNLIKTTGIIIWVGTIIFYILFGIIIQFITKLPLKMTYGGWHIKYPKK
jgi:hypothetical protein